MVAIRIMAMIIYGVRRFGKVDTCSNGAHVATRFFHVSYMPVIPLGSVLVDRIGGEHPIPFSVKSMLVGWVRGGLAVAVVVGASVFFTDKTGTQGSALVTSVFALAFFVASYFAFDASREREREIMGRFSS